MVDEMRHSCDGTRSAARCGGASVAARTTTFGLAATAKGYRTAADVWRAIRTTPGLAVVAVVATLALVGTAGAVTSPNLLVDPGAEAAAGSKDGVSYATWSERALASLVDALLLAPVLAGEGLLIEPSSLWPLADRRRQSLHDKFARTVVVSTRRPAP